MNEIDVYLESVIVSFYMFVNMFLSNINVLRISLNRLKNIERYITNEVAPEVRSDESDSCSVVQEVDDGNEGPITQGFP